MQSSLDLWVEDVEKGIGKTVEEKRQVVSPSDHVNTCSYRSHRTLLHTGSIYVFYRPDGTHVYADYDHVFQNCPPDCLVTAVGKLHEMAEVLRREGVDVQAIAKAFDDDLYIYVSQPDHVKRGEKIASDRGFRAFATHVNEPEQLKREERSVSSYMTFMPSVRTSGMAKGS
ncbi:MAG: hypothetical protein QW351_01080 [Candidatus Caldarchaeum sp.]